MPRKLIYEVTGRGVRIVRVMDNLVVEVQSGTDAMGVLRWRKFNLTDISECALGLEVLASAIEQLSERKQ